MTAEGDLRYQRPVANSVVFDGGIPITAVVTAYDAAGKSLAQLGGAEPTPPPVSADTEPPSSPAPTTTANPEDRLEAWPVAPATPAPVDDLPLLLPTAPIVPAATAVRAQSDGGSGASPMFTQVFADADRNILVTLQTQPNAIESTPSMQRRPDGVPGWDFAPGNEGLVEINGAWNDSAGQRVVTWFDGNGAVAQMLTSPAHTDLINQALGPAFELVDVNGVDGWLNANDGRRSIVWSPDGTTLVVLGVVDDRIDPLTIAVSVTELDVAEYDSRTTTEVPSGVGDGCDGSLFC